MQKSKPGANTALKAILIPALLTVAAPAAVLFDSGAVTFSATGTQFGRLSRDGVSASWGTVKSFPGVVGAPTARGFEAFTVNTGSRTFIQISMDEPNALLFMTAYLNSFNPVNTPPNFGLDVNYLGDPGFSQPLGVPSFFQIQVAPNSQLVIPVNEVTPGTANGAPFELLVEGFFDSSFSDVPPVPEPHSITLLGGAALVVLRLRSSRKATQSGRANA